MAPPPTHETSRWNIPAAVAAWLFPGLGHFWLGEKKRGAILMVGLVILWLSGFLMGGIGIFDHVEHPAWFMGQMLTAPSVAADFAVQTLKNGQVRPGGPDSNPPFEPGYGRINEQGILYTALAGLLNLLAVMDVLYRDPKRIRPDSKYFQPGVQDIAAVQTEETP